MKMTEPMATKEDVRMQAPDSPEKSNFPVTSITVDTEAL
jgi:hypothetical protein